MDNPTLPTLVYFLAALGFLVTSALCGFILALLGQRVIRWYKARKEGDWSFGEYGIMEHLPDGTLKTLSFEDLMAMKQDTQADVEEFWKQQELRAYRLYGAGITREQ